MDGSENIPEIKYNIVTGFGQYGIENFNGVGNPIIDYNDVWGNTSSPLTAIWTGYLTPPGWIPLK